MNVTARECYVIIERDEDGGASHFRNPPHPHRPHFGVRGEFFIFPPSPLMGEGGNGGGEGDNLCKNGMLPEDGYYVGEVPQSKGCYSQGETIDELMANIKEVIELCLEEEGDERV